MSGNDSLGTKKTLSVGDRQFAYYDLAAAEAAGAGDFAALPYALKVLAENLLRHEDGVTVTTDDIRRSAAGPRIAAPTARSPIGRPGSSCRTRRAFLCWLTCRRCATRWCGSAAIRHRLTR